MTKEKVFLTKNELMERWSCSRTTINNQVKKKAIPHFRPTGERKVIFPLDEIVKYEQTHTIREGESKKKKEQPKRKVLSVTTPKKEWRIE